MMSVGIVTILFSCFAPAVTETERHRCSTGTTECTASEDVLSWLQSRVSLQSDNAVQGQIGVPRMTERFGGEASNIPRRSWDNYILRGYQLPLSSFGLPSGNRTRHLTWKTRCIPRDKVDKVKSFVNCMPDLKFDFYTDRGIEEFLRNYSKTSKIPGMEQAVSKMSSSHKWRGIKMAEMSRALMLEDRGGLAFDLDVGCSKSWGPLLDEVEAVMVLEPYDGHRGDIYKHFNSTDGRISPLLADFSSTNKVLSSCMASSRPHTKFFNELAVHTARTINDPSFALEDSPVVNIGPKFHFNFLANWLSSRPPIREGAALASYLLHFQCDACLAVHYGGCTWCNENYMPTDCQDIRQILPKDRLTVFDGQPGRDAGYGK